MKKTLIAVLGMTMLAPMTWAQTNVLSQNAVGYVKVTVPANGGLVLVRHDFESIEGGAQTLDQVLGTDLPNNTVVYKWDRVAGQYDLPGMILTTSVIPPFDKSWSRTDIVIERGDAFWVQNGPSGAETDLFLLGEVPGENNAAGTTVVSPSVGFTGFPYPASTLLVDTDLAAQAPLNTVVYVWDPVAGGWDLPGNIKSQQVFPPFDIVWSRPSQVINPGVGVFVDTAGTFDATETKPYAWP